MLFINYLRGLELLNKEEFTEYEQYIISDLILNIIIHDTEDNNFIENIIEYGVFNNVPTINEEYKSRLIFASYYDYILSYMNDLNKCGDRFNLEINAYNYVHFTYEVVVRMLWSDYCYQLEQMLFNK